MAGADAVTVIELRTGEVLSVTSTRPATTGATSRKARADGPGLLSLKTRLTCRDSRQGWS